MLQNSNHALLSVDVSEKEFCHAVIRAVYICITDLQSLKEAKGAQPSTPRYQTECGVVQHFSVVVPEGKKQKTMGYSLYFK